MLDKLVQEEEQQQTYNDKTKKEKWCIQASSTANNCKNYIRYIIDQLDLKPNPNKSVIALSIGDPTVYGNLKPAAETISALLDVIQEGKCNGYAPCVGYEKSREAVAQYLNKTGTSYTFQDIILCSGCSNALEICITALCDEKQKHNILIPKPGFAIYRTLAEAIGIKVKYYNLLSERNWEVDLEHLKAQIDQNTACIVVNNPSNPCGCVYSKKHLEAILEVALIHQVPVIADEIYEQIVFSGSEFVSTATLSSPVPILVCGGLAKRFLVPGWRLGWIAIHDPSNLFRENVRGALVNLTQRIIGSNTLVQGALPAILADTPQSFYDGLVGTLEKHARLVFGRLQGNGLEPFMPQGTMYMMVKIDLDRFPFADVLDFVVKLMEEESVFCLPGSIPDFVRIVLTVPEDLLREACERILTFTQRYYKNK